MHKEFRRFAQMPIGVMSKPCNCWRKWENKKHWWSHQYWIKPCRKQDEIHIKYSRDNLNNQSIAQDLTGSWNDNNDIISAPIVIPVYPAGIPEGGVKRQRGRPKKIKPEDLLPQNLENEEQKPSIPPNNTENENSESRQIKEAESMVQNISENFAESTAHKPNEVEINNMEVDPIGEKPAES